MECGGKCLIKHVKRVKSGWGRRKNKRFTEKSEAKNGKSVTYNHDKVYEVMKSKLSTMNCFLKYKSYTSSTSVPVLVRDLMEV